MLIEIKEPGAHSDENIEREYALGIDLGTTNSVVAVSEDGECKAFADEGSDLIPSVYLLDGQSIIIGRKAQGREGSVHSIKRQMGKSSSDATAVKISSEILKKLKNLAEKELDKQISKAVITVPAYFDDAARMATKDAAKLAGLEVLRLINEPTAAALAYGLDNAAEGIYAIYDLGGGTFDISILKMEKGVFKVLSTAGDTELGGDDFDAEIAKFLNIDKHEARKIKEKLTTDNEAEGITRKKFESLIEKYINKTISICKQAVSDSSVTLEDIKGIVLVGGSTRIPLVKTKVAEYFGRDPLVNIDPDRVVAFGAAIQAENLTMGSGLLLLDVNPLSLGLETYGGLVEKIIERNSPIPSAKSQEFTTYQDGQTSMKIHILQGEREMVDQCRSLARFTLTGIPLMAAGLAKIRVTFTVDSDGLLTVSAKETETGAEQKIEVKPSYGLPPEEIEKMLRDSFANAKTDILQRLVAESRLEAEQLIRTIENAIKQDGDLLDKAEDNAISGAIKDLREAIGGSNRDLIDVKAQELDKISSTFAEKRVNRALSNALKGQKINNVNLKKA